MNFRGSKSRRWRDLWSRWQQRLVNAFVTPWTTVVRWCSAFVQAIGTAWNTRQLRYMIQGFPAVFATVGAIVLALNVAAKDRANLASDYYAEAGRALTNQQFELARTYCEKAISLGGPEPEYRFFLVLALTSQAEKKPETKQQQLNHAFAIVKTLAPDDRTVYPPAHEWMGEFIERYAPLNDNTVRIMERQFTRAYTGGLERDPKKFAETIKKASERLAHLYMLTGRPAEAEKHLLRGMDSNPIFKVWLGKYYKSKNRNEEAQRMFNSAIEAFRKKLETEPDDLDARMGLVQALLDQDQSDEALKELETGLTLKPSEFQYTQAIANIFAAKEIELSRKPDASIEARLFLIQSGLQRVPANRILLQRLIQLSEMQGEDGEKAKKAMQAMLADGKAAPILHFLLGQRAYREEKFDDARSHWEQAYKLDPKFGWVANNLAWMMAQPKDVDQKTLEAALEIINSTIKQMGNIAPLYGTRGEILVKLGKYNEAIPDLKIGIQATRDSLSLHEAILLAYEKTGNTTWADVHRKKVEELRAKNVKPIMPDAPPAGDGKPAEKDKDAPPPDATPTPKDQPPPEKR